MVSSTTKRCMLPFSVAPRPIYRQRLGCMFIDSQFCRADHSLQQLFGYMSSIFWIHYIKRPKPSSALVDHRFHRHPNNDACRWFLYASDVIGR